MIFSEKMKAKAAALGKRLVLPEGAEPRTIEAARKILDQKIASEVTLLGDPSEIQKAADGIGVELSGIKTVDPAASPDRADFATEYYNLRKAKGMTEKEADALIVDTLRWGAMMLRKGKADAMVAGAERTTADVLRAGFQIIKTRPPFKYASSCFVMSTDKRQYGAEGSFIFADCATIPNPTAEQLAEIAVASADSCRTFIGVEPVVALLSYSTKGSAKGDLIDKVTEALALAKQASPDLAIDGEIQADAAIEPSVARKKAPGSAVAGKANVLVFPDLQAGNIGYKLVQRLAGAQAYGPILQGFARPVSDLSRGCDVEDIVVTSAITLTQAGGK